MLFDRIVWRTTLGLLLLSALTVMGPIPGGASVPERRACVHDVATRVDPALKGLTPPTAIAPAPASPAKAHHYALIINGDAGSHHVQNCIDSYAALRANGFTDQDIFLLSNEPRVGSMSVPTLGHNDGPPSYRNLATVFKFLKDQVKSTDLLVIYVTGHGGIERDGAPPQCFIELVPRVNDSPVAHGPQLELDEFVADVAAIKPARGLLLFDQCYGQAFASVLGKGPYASIALSMHPEEVFCQNFSPVFWSEVRKSGLSRKKDSEHSLKAAFSKAYKYARKKEKTQKPLLKSAFDTSKFFLWE